MTVFADALTRFFTFVIAPPARRLALAAARATLPTWPFSLGVSFFSVLTGAVAAAISACFALNKLLTSGDAFAHLVRTSDITAANSSREGRAFGASRPAALAALAAASAATCRSRLTLGRSSLQKRIHALGAFLRALVGACALSRQGS
eukprot:7385926-Prymnesium_polylepis.2